MPSGRHGAGWGAGEPSDSPKHQEGGHRQRVRGLMAPGVHTGESSSANSEVAGRGGGGVWGGQCPVLTPPASSVTAPLLLSGVPLPFLPSPSQGSLFNSNRGSGICFQRHGRRCPSGPQPPPLKVLFGRLDSQNLVPTIFLSLGISPPPARQPQGWAGAIFSLGTELILTHRQGPGGGLAGRGEGKDQSGKAGLQGPAVVSGPRCPRKASGGRLCSRG